MIEKRPASINKLWVEKYRPQKLSDIIFQNEAYKKFFENAVTAGEIPNLLLSGVQGTGKTTISTVLIHELGIQKGDYLKVKCSDETGVDAMRDKISRFAETVAMGNFKIVQMEEADFLSQNAQAVLRHIVEDNSANCRFIFTCNYSNKLMPALKSRLQEFNFKAPPLEDVMVKMAEMLTSEGIDLEDASTLDTFEKVIASTYPDIRKTIQVLYQCTRTGKLIWQAGASGDGDYKFKLLEILEKGDFVSARKLICENVNRDEYEDLYYWLYKNIHRAPKFQSKEKLEAAIVVISDYEYKSSFMAHQDLNAEAMFISLGNL